MDLSDLSFCRLPQWIFLVDLDENLAWLTKNVTPLSQKCGEKQKGSAVKVGPYLSFLKPFQY